MTGLTVRFWGTRGSIPTPGRRTEKYGGNTTCMEIRHQDTIIVIDAGSGIRRLSEGWAKEFAGRPINATLLFTHAHWDHIQGFPFFGPAYQAGNRFTIRGDADLKLQELLSDQMGGAYFPIPISAMEAEINFEAIATEMSIGTLTVRSQLLPHPGGSLGYRFESGESALIVASDVELDQVALNREEILNQIDLPRQYDPKFLSFFQGVDTLVIDAQYTDEEYPQRVGWGHNSTMAVVDFCRQVRPKMLVLFHHDPRSSDAHIDKMLDNVAERIRETGTTTVVAAAREMLTLRVGRAHPSGTS